MAEKPEHILIVDDEPDLEILIKQRLRKDVRAGKYVLHFVQNGQEALETLQQNPEIFIVITDISMPVMNGLELLRRINEMQNPKLKVIIASAYSDMDNIRFAMNHGAFDFLTKPINLTDLENIIEKTLELILTIRKGLKAQEIVEHYDVELKAAKEVQTAMLPKKFPPFSELKEFDIYGQMEAAESVGGDFFDFFLINDDKIGFVIGDVSGKGIPAAIYMALATTIIRSFGQTYTHTNECIRKANELLCSSSSNGMFVTIFYGVLNFKTGEFNYTNAGHNYPFLVTDKNKVVELNTTSNVLLGAFDNAEFTENTIQLEPNTLFVSYTDGVTEAMNKDKQLLGVSPLENYLSYISVNDSPKIVSGGIFDLVKHHAEGTKQSDDITVLTLAYYGK
ncbi:MAG: SpoIIE family protein phosphatase [Bacteroidetes bacterium]|nr:SpoIIE family protein phosphatase [Bacteroidota bacterium]